MGLAPLAQDNGFDITLKVGIAFEESQLNEKGWFIDTDSVEEAIDEWTNLFTFRPTFEQVAKWIYHKLQPDIPQLSYIELGNNTVGVKTKYSQAK